VSKKPKPATVGFKISIDHCVFPDGRLVYGPVWAKRLARRIDAAVRRAVKKERDRCIACLQHGGWDVPLTLMDGSNP
jgi:hypothetical protein